MKPFDKEIHQKKIYHDDHPYSHSQIIIIIIFFEFRKLSVIYKIRKFPRFELTQIDLRSNNFLSH